MTNELFASALQSLQARTQCGHEQEINRRKAFAALLEDCPALFPALPGREDPRYWADVQLLYETITGGHLDVIGALPGMMPRRPQPATRPVGPEPMAVAFWNPTAYQTLHPELNKERN